MQKVTNVWQDNKIPNGIPPTAVLLRSFLTLQNFGSLRSLRMTHRGICGGERLKRIVEDADPYGFEKFLNIVR